ncbi:LysR family transcriptional regulator [Oleisolibacter albus]|uniref:LysR family transcriptional regulator n=1 Tax=Oleisolibacter albus TaxID=2171757 RepID=UPI000DF38BE1|nr:LysR family transcriptional regulator [Oleisolibacter albus]
MRFKKLDLNLLVALDALLTTQSVTAAAERLHLSQPATSYALTRLRDVFDDELLVLSGKKMVPTPIANELLPQVRDILARVDNMVSSASSFDPALSKRNFRIAASDYANLSIITPSIEYISRSAPGITVSLVPFFTQPVLADLVRGDIDFLIIPTDFPDVSDCHRHVISTEPFVCIAWSGNTDLQAPITIDDFSRHDHVIMTPYGTTQKSVDEQFFHQRGIIRTAAIRTALHSSIPGFLVGTDRIGCIPKSLALLFSRCFPIKIVETAFTMPTITQTLTWHLSRDKDEALKWVKDVIIDVTKIQFGK